VLIAIVFKFMVTPSNETGPRWTQIGEKIWRCGHKMRQGVAFEEICASQLSDGPVNNSSRFVEKI
jgi:hypothetical protein